jgi:hypothetical protein
MAIHFINGLQDENMPNWRHHLIAGRHHCPRYVSISESKRTEADISCSCGNSSLRAKVELAGSGEHAARHVCTLKMGAKLQSGLHGTRKL